MRILDYKPIVYDKNAEMNEIYNSLDTEFEGNIKQDVIQVFKNTFVILADEQGIKDFEDMLDIIADPQTESLEFRRERIIYRLNSQLPYTYRYLEDKFNSIMGEGNWNATLSYNTYTLTINLTIPGREWYIELINLLDTVLPCNIRYIINTYAASWGQVRDNFTTWNDITSLTWQDVLDATWINN